MKDLLKFALLPAGFCLIFIGFFSEYFLIALGIAIAIFSIVISEEKPERKESGIISLVLLGPGLYLIRFCNSVAIYKMLVAPITSAFSTVISTASILLYSSTATLLAGIFGLIISEISLGLLYEFLPKNEGSLTGIGLCAVGFLLALIGLGFPFVGIVSAVLISAGLFAITISLSLSLISRSEVKSSEGNSQEPS